MESVDTCWNQNMRQGFSRSATHERLEVLEEHSFDYLCKILSVYMNYVIYFLLTNI